jgi:acetyl-CoA synthetase
VHALDESAPIRKNVAALAVEPNLVDYGAARAAFDWAGEMVRAFVALKPGFEPTDALRRELYGFARTRLCPAVAPKESSSATIFPLPKTRSWKIMRRLLRARELGLPEGDVSTLEEHFGGR